MKSSPCMIYKIRNVRIAKIFYISQSNSSEAVLSVWTAFNVSEFIISKDYPCFMLDAANNKIELYKSLGFAETHRVKEKFAKQAGFEYTIFMKLK